MDSFISSNLAHQMAEFRFPRYDELPNIELYLEQVLTYLDDILIPLFGAEDENLVTPSMISNYIKQEVLPRPIKKKYNKEHLAYLIFIFVSKQVMSIGEVQQLIGVQKSTYPINIAYNYFSTELENILKSIFTDTEPLEDTVTIETQESKIIRVAVAMIGRKIYLNKYLQFIESKEN